MVDSSGSIGDATYGGDPANWARVLQLLRLLIQSIDNYSTIGVTSRVAIINYSHYTEVVVDLSENLNKDQLLTLINKGRVKLINSGTDIYRAAETASELLLANIRIVSGSIQATQAVIFFTDGDSKPSPLSVFKRMMNRGVHVILVGKCTCKS